MPESLCQSLFPWLPPLLYPRPRPCWPSPCGALSSTGCAPPLPNASPLSHGSFYRLIGTKDRLLEAVYTYALDQLLVPLPAGEAAPPRQGLHGQLARWWQQLADAALAHPEAFAFWRLYRTSLYPLANDRPDLGPSMLLLAHLRPVLPSSPAGGAPTFSATLLAELLAAQWLAAVEVALSNPGCRAQPALRAHLLVQAYAGWWRTTGLPHDTPAIAAELP